MDYEKKYIDAERLQKEVKRLKRAVNKSALDCADSETRKFLEGKALAYQLVGILISLQQEQPSEDLEAEVDRYVREQWDMLTSTDSMKSIVRRIAHHFANWQKEQMLKDAVEGYVNYYEDSGGILMAEAQVGCPYHIGDKVKIVIVKED